MENEAIKSVYTFFFSERKTDAHVCVPIGKMFFSCDEQTGIDKAQSGDSELLLFGDAVNVVTGNSVSLAQQILNQSSDIWQVADCERELGGKYIIVYRKAEDYYLLGDATCSIPIFYSVGEAELCCSSNSVQIAKFIGAQTNDKLSEIRQSGDISQAMPYDVTPYHDVKCLLPNHFLQVSDRSANRLINSNCEQTAVTYSQAAEITVPMILRLSEYYLSKYKIYCPITGGKDSRVVSAFLTSLSPGLVHYTIKHKNQSENNPDLSVPKILAKKNNLTYEQISDEDVPCRITEYFDGILGKNQYSPRTLMIAYTINNHYGDGAVINGDIMGQIGKCSLHRDIPEYLATAGYFQCKLHNYSHASKLLLQEWLNEISASGEKVNTFDLFSVESRLGRWAAQENLIYNTIGQRYLNIFNSRSIIYVWTAVERKIRKNHLIHNEILEKISPELLEIPFGNGGSPLKSVSKSNALFYYISSFAKFYYERYKFRKAQDENETNNCHCR